MPCCVGESVIMGTTEWLLAILWVLGSAMLIRRLALLRGDQGKVAQVIIARHSGLLIAIQFIPIILFVLPHATVVVVVGATLIITFGAISMLIRADRLQRKLP